MLGMPKLFFFLKSEAGYLSMMSSIAVTGDFESEHTHRSFTDLIFQFYLQATIGRSFFFE